MVEGSVRLGPVDDFSIPVAQIDSPPLGAIIRYMDRESDNFTAELLLKQLGAVELDRGTSAAGASVVMQALAEANGIKCLTFESASHLPIEEEEALLG